MKICRPFLQSPYFTPAELSGNEDEFFPALTDNGICHVYNGNSLRNTYKIGGRRIAELSRLFDQVLDFVSITL